MIGNYEELKKYDQALVDEMETLRVEAHGVTDEEYQSFSDHVRMKFYDGVIWGSIEPKERYEAIRGQIAPNLNKLMRKE